MPEALPASFTVGREARAVADARDFVVGCVTGRLDDLRENAELITSELVTNVLIHTESPATLYVTLDGRTMRVEVHDDSPVLPVGGILERTAANGRGLVLVEQLTHRWGITRLADAGKSVWFELVAGVPPRGDELSVDDLLDMWGDDEDVASPMLDVHPNVEDEGPGEAAAADPTVGVRLENVPTQLLNATKSHLDELIRDLTLAAESAAPGHPQDNAVLDLGARLATLAAELVDFRNQIRRQAIDAMRRHDETLTLELHVPRTFRQRLVDYRQALDDAEDLAASGKLLVPPAPPEHVEFRRWKLTRIIEQLSTRPGG